MERKFRKTMVLRFAAMFIAFALVAGFATMGLWNWLVPALFHGPVLTYGQALGLLVLCRLLFGGFKGRGEHHGWRRGPVREDIRKRLEEKMSSMSEEQREKLRRKMNRWEERHPHPGVHKDSDEQREQND